MSSGPSQSRAVLHDGHVYLLQEDGSYAREDLSEAAPDIQDVSDDEIDRQIAADPDAAPEPTDADLERARVVRPYRTSEQV